MLTAKAFKRIYELDDRLLDEVKHRLLVGHSAPKVVAFVQASGAWLDCEPNPLIRQLQRYHSEVLVPAIADGEMHLPPDASRIDVIRELSRLIDRQKKRVSKMQRQEDKLPTLLDAVSHEILILAKLLDRLAWLQLEVGILKRVPRSATLALRVMPDTQGSHVVDPDVVAFRLEEPHMTLLPKPREPVDD